MSKVQLNATRPANGAHVYFKEEKVLIIAPAYSKDPAQAYYDEMQSTEERTQVRLVHAMSSRDVLHALSDISANDISDRENIKILTLTATIIQAVPDLKNNPKFSSSSRQDPVPVTFQTLKETPINELTVNQLLQICVEDMVQRVLSIIDSYLEAEGSMKATVITTLHENKLNQVITLVRNIIPVFS